MSVNSIQVFLSDGDMSYMQIVPCIRLLKPFDAKAFSGNDEVETDAQLRGAKRGQITNQMVELSIDRQIYDLVDNAGREGLYMMDVSNSSLSLMSEVEFVDFCHQKWLTSDLCKVLCLLFLFPVSFMVVIRLIWPPVDCRVLRSEIS